ncbi:uncharacterized protein LOC110443501 [Mizuhopecten yessoensis]|uniref:Uncharacterized protein n=1 Tax=Mizuhopecten yessoensis TaxID=6573 RepID=A0A210PES2_MIZYE|nr:uncharacterized protein LOC110443501 [Mizuhopecten yessoensis]OWF34990.1 hypothetical protein KP79_PYT23812 [Mizuhopecten yessoensis]
MACGGECYYCMKPPERGMDLDSALHELGMLSSGTNSRKEYIKERKRSTSESSSSRPFNEPMSRAFNEPVPFNEPASNFQGKGFHILQVDPKYVTGFSADFPVVMNVPKFDIDASMDASKIPSTSETSPILDPRTRDCFCVQGSCHHSDATPKQTIPKRSMLRKGRYKRYLKPYEVPWRLHNSPPEVEMHHQEHSLSKSNESSPVKALSGEGGPLTRSRSLNNLESARARLADIFEEPHPHHSADRQEIEKVSQQIENLHFVEKT